MGYKIAQVGSFDVENYGDLLFSDVLEKQLKKRLSIEEMIYFAPKNCMMPNRNEKVYSVTELEKMVQDKKIDAIVVGGGDLIHFVKIQTSMPHISESWLEYEALYMWIIPCFVAYKYNIPLLWNAPGVPMKFVDVTKEIVETLCETVDYISVRDEEAKKVLAETMDAEKIKVVPDSVLSISEVYKKEELYNQFLNLPYELKEEQYIVFQVNMTMSDDELKICGETLIRLRKETGMDIVLQPIGYALGDEKTLHVLEKKYPGEFILSTLRLSQYDILALIAYSGGYIGTSMHGCVTANAYGVKNVVFNFNRFNKIEGLVELLDIEENRVFHAKDIYSAYEKSESSQKMRDVVNEIDKHFDIIAECIENKNVKEKTVFAHSMAECFCNLNMYVESITRERKKNEQDYMELRKEYLELRRGYDTVVNSTSWKMTKLFRMVMDKIKFK